MTVFNLAFLFFIYIHTFILFTFIVIRRNIPKNYLTCRGITAISWERFWKRTKLREIFKLDKIQDQISSSECSAPTAGLSLQIQASRLPFCPKTGLPPQNKEPRLLFYYGWIGAVASRCSPHPALFLASEQTLKDLKSSQGHQHGG